MNKTEAAYWEML